ncbi:MAG: methylmalonyl Co-A mutase-associated GTPase MeaB [Elusimicrobia bacterium]|nr:methylmalonyl Co-A mutase-associated GTPase MeaB [Elusimicrobiota bacterium]
MPSAKDVRELAARVRRGDRAAAARALSIVTEERPGHEALAGAFFSDHGASHTVGLCGSPGSGKSSLVNRLVTRLRAAGETVGVLAVDPTSAFTGGAFLGDRMRFQAHSLDDGVFMRSLATRGMMGGLNATIFAAIHVLEACGFSKVLVETVGTGQDEVDVAEVVDTVVCVSAPYQGDEFQAMKAGTMEIGDVFAVNKADLPEVERAVAMLKDALSLNPLHDGGWAPRIAPVSALTGKGVAELAADIDAHRAHLASSGELESRRRRQLRRELSLVLSRRLYRDAMARVTDRHIDLLAAKKSSPQSLGGTLLAGRK